MGPKFNTINIIKNRKANVIKIIPNIINVSFLGYLYI